MTRPVYTSPIIFSAPMVRALLDSRKTQTRRLITSQWSNVKMHHEMGERVLLWVRETWSPHYTQIESWPPHYRADLPHDRSAAMTEDHSFGLMHWKPSIRMPRSASRLTLELSDVRVQQLQEISEEDAVAEGATSRPACHGFGSRDAGWSMDWSNVGTLSRWGKDQKLTERDVCLGSARFAFAAFINELHGGKLWNCKPEQPLWDANPSVVALSFRVHWQNVDAVIGEGGES